MDLGTSSVPGAQDWGLCPGPGLIFAILYMERAECNRKVSLHSQVLTVVRHCTDLNPFLPCTAPSSQADAETPTRANTLGGLQGPSSDATTQQ